MSISRSFGALSKARRTSARRIGRTYTRHPQIVCVSSKVTPIPGTRQAQRGQNHSPTSGFVSVIAWRTRSSLACKVRASVMGLEEGEVLMNVSDDFKIVPPNAVKRVFVLFAG